jgi:hypothetical protein
VKISLCDWDIAGQAWVFDTSSGRILTLADAPCHGFVHRSSGKAEESELPQVTAIYSDGSVLWFQADGLRWEIGDIEFWQGYDESGMGSFSASVRGSAVIDATYPGPLADPVYSKDPSLDALDVEMLDFFHYIARNCRSETWKDGMRVKWGTGISP